jgi:hypothetical protein
VLGSSRSLGKENKIDSLEFRRIEIGFEGSLKSYKIIFFLLQVLHCVVLYF